MFPASCSRPSTASWISLPLPLGFLFSLAMGHCLFDHFGKFLKVTVQLLQVDILAQALGKQDVAGALRGRGPQLLEAGVDAFLQRFASEALLLPQEVGLEYLQHGPEPGLGLPFAVELRRPV